MSPHAQNIHKNLLKNWQGLATFCFCPRYTFSRFGQAPRLQPLFFLALVLVLVFLLVPFLLAWPWSWQTRARRKARQEWHPSAGPRPGPAGTAWLWPRQRSRAKARLTATFEESKSTVVVKYIVVKDIKKESKRTKAPRLHVSIYQMHFW